MKHRIDAATRSRHAIRTLDWIFQQPVFSSTNFAEGTGIPVPSAHRILVALQEHRILQNVSKASGSRPAILAFSELLEIIEA